MNLIKQHFDKNNLHHAYLIEGSIDKILPEVFSFIEELGVKTVGNPDFVYLAYDSFKMSDAQFLKSKVSEKNISSDKRIYIISANNFLHEAQNTLLKIFEEPGENTHYFVILPNIEILFSTVKSRFYIIRPEQDNTKKEIEEIKKFLSATKKERLDIIKELIVEEDEEDREKIENTSRAKAINFLNTLEVVLHNNFISQIAPKALSGGDYFEQIFKVRMYLSQPGSSVKNLMESLALILPKL